MEAYFDGTAPRQLSTPRRKRGGSGGGASGASGATGASVRITDPTCAFMEDPDNRGENGDVDRVSPRVVVVDGGVLGGKTPGRTPRRLGAPRRALASTMECATTAAMGGKTPKSTEKTPVRRSPRLALLAQSSEKKKLEELASAEKSTTSASKGRRTRFASQTPAKRILKTPNPMIPRVAVVAKHKQEAARKEREAREEAARKKRAAMAPAGVSSRYRQTAPKTDVKQFRSRKEKLRAFETGGRTTDYEDLTQIPARKTTTKAVSPKFNITRRKEKILTTEERELLEIEKAKESIAKERERRRNSSYENPFTRVNSRVYKSVRNTRANPAPSMDDVASALKAERSRRTSAPIDKIERTPMTDARKRKRISITGSVLTEITPFNLNTEQRGAYHERKFRRMLEEEEQRESLSQPRFRATPIPVTQQAGTSISRQQLSMMLRNKK
jgi:hypothetical protein